MSLLEPPVEKSHKPRAMAFTIAALVLVGAAVLWFTFRYYPEKKATEAFFEALAAGDTNRAYQLWKPSPSYTQNRFLADWGPDGYYGPIKSFKVMRATAPKDSNAISVTVAISPFSPLPEESDAVKSVKTKTVTLWVSPSDKSLSFPP